MVHHTNEQTGNCERRRGYAVLAIAWVLRAEAGFERLFELPPFRTIDEALAQEQVVTRKRARSSR